VLRDDVEVVLCRRRETTTTTTSAGGEVAAEKFQSAFYVSPMDADRFEVAPRWRHLVSRGMIKTYVDWDAIVAPRSNHDPAAQPTNPVAAQMCVSVGLRRKNHCS
jgi:hypothetical protein